MKFTEADSGCGPVYTLTKGDLRAAVHMPAIPALAELTEANRAFGEQLTHVAATYQDAKWPGETAKIAGPILKATRAAVEAGQDARRNLAERKARARTRPPTLADKSNDAEIRAQYRGADIGAQIEGVKGADLRALAALVAEGNLARLDPRAFELAEQRYLALAHIERTGMGADFQRQPTLQQLTASGVDMEAAEAAATGLIAQFEQAEADLDATESALQHQIAMLSIALQLPPSKVLEMVLSA